MNDQNLQELVGIVLSALTMWMTTSNAESLIKSLNLIKETKQELLTMNKALESIVQSQTVRAEKTESILLAINTTLKELQNFLQK